MEGCLGIQNSRIWQEGSVLWLKKQDWISDLVFGGRTSRAEAPRLS